MLDVYLARSAELKPMTGTDAYGTPIYGAPQTVACRFVPQLSQYSGDSSRTVYGGGVYYLTARVRAGDMLDGRAVKAVSPMVGLSGDAVGFKAVVE